MRCLIVSDALLMTRFSDRIAVTCLDEPRFFVKQATAMSEKITLAQARQTNTIESRSTDDPKSVTSRSLVKKTLSRQIEIKLKLRH